jgi:hypothetical protein
MLPGPTSFHGTILSEKLVLFVHGDDPRSCLSAVAQASATQYHALVMEAQLLSGKRQSLKGELHRPHSSRWSRDAPFREGIGVEKVCGSFREWLRDSGKH